MVGEREKKEKRIDSMNDRLRVAWCQLRILIAKPNFRLERCVPRLAWQLLEISDNSVVRP